MKQARYLRPKQLSEALAALGDRPWSVLAGGTAFFPARLGNPVDEDALDVSAISDAHAVTREGGYWHIPMLATWSDLIANQDLPKRFDGLKKAARELGSMQIQNVATICGNLCNASSAVDHARAASVFNSARQTGSVLGVALFGSLIAQANDFLFGVSAALVVSALLLVAAAIAIGWRNRGERVEHGGFTRRRCCVSSRRPRRSRCANCRKGRDQMTEMTEQHGLTPIGNTKRADSKRVFAFMAAPTTLLPSTTMEAAMREKRLSKDRTNFGMEVPHLPAAHRR